eukprot:Awhi_evm1s13405
MSTPTTKKKGFKRSILSYALDPQDLKLFQKACSKVQRYKETSKLVLEGSPVDALYIVEKGSVVLAKDNLKISEIYG